MCLHSSSRIAITTALVGVVALWLALAAARGAELFAVCTL